MRETILTERWKDEDWKAPQAEEEILKRLAVTQSMVSRGDQRKG